MDQIKNTFNEISKIAHELNAEVELLIQGGENLSLKYQNKKLDQFSSSQSQVAGFRVVKSGHQGYAYSENLESENLKRCFKDALENCEMLLKSEGPKEEIPMAIPEKSDFQIQYFNQKDQASIEDKKTIAKDLEEKTFASSPMVVNVPYSSLSETASWGRILNSKGIDQTFEKKYYVAFTGPLLEKNNKKKSTFYGVVKPKLSEIQVEKISQKAVDKVLPFLDAQQLPTGNYPTMFANEIAGDFVSMLIDSLSAKEVFQEKSFLKGKLGQKIFSEKINLIDDPVNDRLYGARPFDSEGSVSKKVSIIDHGILKSYLTNLEYAKKMNLPHTASAARSPRGEMGIQPASLVMEKGTRSRSEILSGYEKSILITSVQGGLHAGFNDTTGDFSLPVEGLIYENGQLIGAFDQTVVSGNILTMLADVIEIGNEYFENANDSLFPDLMVKELSFAGQSN